MKFLDIQCVLLVSPQLLCEKFLILRTKRDMIKKENKWPYSRLVKSRLQSALNRRTVQPFTKSDHSR
jgi:hypothetical protein